MLSPEATLREIVRSIEEGTTLDAPTHISKRRARKLFAEGLRAVRELVRLEQSEETEIGRKQRIRFCIACALLDLESGSRTGV